MKNLPSFALILSLGLLLTGCTTIVNNGSTSSAEATSNTPVEYSAAEVAEHSSRTDCWTINSGKVYDITSFIGRHPGGADKIAQACGKDSTALFNSVSDHAERNAPAQLSEFQIGVLAN